MATCLDYEKEILFDFFAGLWWLHWILLLDFLYLFSELNASLNKFINFLDFNLYIIQHSFTLYWICFLNDHYVCAVYWGQVEPWWFPEHFVILWIRLHIFIIFSYLWTGTSDVSVHELYTSLLHKAVWLFV